MSTLPRDLTPLPSLLERRAALAADRWLLLLAVVIAGYILFGRTFAYVGVRPIFIGEITLALGAGCFLVMRRWHRVLRMSVSWVLVTMMALGVLRTLPYVGEHGIDAVRDFMLLGYATVALLTAGVILDRPERLAMVLGWYRRAVPWLVVGAPAVWACRKLMGEVMTPGLGVPMFDVKPGDAQVHLAGALAFWCSGLAAAIPLWAAAAMAVGVGAMGAFNRGGLVSFGFAACICMAARPRATALRTVAIVGTLILTAALAADVTIRVPGEAREVSAQQVLANVASIFGGSGERDQLHGTKEWRLAWWNEILSYTVYGEHFWTGKGFGVNLANADGFQVNDDESLRSPHNGHLTVLARAGVPGFCLWLTAHAAWFGMMARGWWMSRLRGDVQWNGLFLFLGAYAVAFLLNASFDVFLEGPMGAIPFWAVFGVGMAAAWCYRHRPDVLGAA